MITHSLFLLFERKKTRQQTSDILWNWRWLEQLKGIPLKVKSVNLVLGAYISQEKLKHCHVTMCKCSVLTLATIFMNVTVDTVNLQPHESFSVSGIIYLVNRSRREIINHYWLESDITDNKLPALEAMLLKWTIFSSVFFF